MAQGDLRNEYQSSIGDLFEKTPKSVFAALAVSFAARLNEDNIDSARAFLISEWSALHVAGIIPQKPPKAGA